MRIILLLIIIISCSTVQNVMSQEVRILVPDTISLSDEETYKVFISSKDTLGFLKLTDKISLDIYKGNENKDIMRVMRKLKKAMDGDILYDEIAGKRIASLQNLSYAIDFGEHHILRSPKYALTKNGVIVIGRKDVLAPWMT